jgi:peptidoglycan/LPS O-acetylase OafA/YrhL
MSATAQERPNYYLLTIARFFAALWVVFVHIPQLAPKEVVANLTWFDNFIAKSGGIGVNFFFVLSGYILTKLYPPKFSKRRFYWKRFARIYPAYFVLLLFPLALYIYRGQLFGVPRVELIACSVSTIALVHAWIPPFTHTINGPGWSLSCEAFFYVMFPFLRGNEQKPSWYLLSAASLLTLSPWIVWHVLTASWGFGIDPNRSSLASLPHFPLVAIPDFFFGILIAKLPVPSTSRKWLLLLGLLLLTLLCAADLPGFATVPCGLIILALSITKPATELSPSERAMEYLGHASYSLYLVHVPFIKYVSSKGFLSSKLQAAVLILSAVILSCGAYTLIDKPLFTRLGRMAKRTAR